MIAAAREPHPGRLEVEARALADRHTCGRPPARPLRALAAVPALRDWFERVCDRMQERDSEPAIAEWVLDNRHVLLRAVEEISRDLPPGYYCRLPPIASGDAAGTPRVYVLARSLAALSSLQFDLTSITHFVASYQEAGPLNISELWALPTMLRLVCLEVVVHAAVHATPGIAPPYEQGIEPLLLRMDDAERVGRAIRALDAISSIPWNVFVERTSAVEAALTEDPAGAYASMDFETRDRYRRAVEEITACCERSEHEVVLAVLEQCRDAGASTPLHSHVGFWLVGEGREELERVIGARLRPVVRLRRAAARRAVALYLLSILAATGCVLAVPLVYLHAQGAGPLTMFAGALLALLPASSFAVATIHWLTGRLVPPPVLPKLCFERGIPEQWRTAVVVPTMLTSAEAVSEMVGVIERHYLANPDPGLVFVLLTDFADAAEKELPGDAELVEQAARGVRALNEKYRADGPGRFYLAHRERRFNSREGCWMGWERKRGKLEEWDAHLRGRDTSFVRQEGDREALAATRFVITLDSDTVLPRGAAARLAGVLAHPLNRPRFDATSDRLVSGYTVVQPRVEISPESGERSVFTHVYAGDTAIDIYSRAVSDVYQDLFGTGIYVGKGIYDVHAFRASLEGRVPENALASHDLLEGIHGRAALATDVVLYEAFPSHYLAFVQRMHRWIRGDWQLIPWLWGRVPSAAAERVASRFSVLERWMIVDNLRRSLLSPSLLVLLAAGWMVLPGNPLVWTLLAIAAPAGHCVLDLVAELSRLRPWGGERRVRVHVSASRAGTQFKRLALLLVFLPYESLVAADAVVRTIVRVALTHRRLLQWRTAAQTAARFESGASRWVTWRAMAIAPATAAVLAAATAWIRPAALPAAIALLATWLFSPEVAHRISVPLKRRMETLGHDQRLLLRRLARRTWLFFETFVGPDDHWLPPDNYQEVPTGEVDHRTSPTNVGMLLLSTTAAWDLGYVGPRDLAVRLRSTLATADRLERYKGHLLNWYDTRTLEPLAPRYVSTVDSGNFAAVLISVAEACRGVAAAPVLSRARWDGLMDALAWLEDALARLVPDEPLAQLAATIRRRVGTTRDDPASWAPVLADLCERECKDFDKLLSEAIQRHEAPLLLPALHELRIWLDRVHRHLRAMHADVESLLAWLPLLDGHTERQSDRPGTEKDTRVAVQIAELLPMTVALERIPDGCAQARELLSELRVARVSGQPVTADTNGDAWIDGLDAALTASAERAAALVGDYRGLAARCEAEALGTDFHFLYDAERDLFHIGYNVSADTLDPHHYDLLASECRLASYIAIAKGDVPVKHWRSLGRPMTRVAGSVALLSWGGTMFEYLMPRLLLRGGGDDLLTRSEGAAIDAQRAFALRHGIPWGVSESGYAAMDAEHNYQYRAFGVPGLGLKRDLGSEIVVAPYATALAVPIRPAEAVENIVALRALGAIGEYGLHEAVDFTPTRLPRGVGHVVVRSYMAHHQGMALAAIGNFLSGFPHVRRFHAHPVMHAAELLLHERIPVVAPLEFPRTAPPPPPERAEARTLYPWSPVIAGAFPELHAVGNGRLTSIVTDSGAGGLRWLGRALTRWLPDATLDSSGAWIYVRDLEDGALWSVGRQPTAARAESYEVVFHSHMVEVRRRDRGIAIRFETGVAPGDDIEIRRVTIVNESDRPRQLALTSYAEPVLAPVEQDRQHPAFSKLFVDAEEIADLDGLLFERRSRSEKEQPPLLLHRLVADSPNIRRRRFELSRERFLGRYGSERSPLGLRQPDATGGAAAADTGLDPIMSIEAVVELAPGATEQLAFVTLVGGSTRSLTELADRYHSLAALEWALTDAAAESGREALRLGVDPALMPSFQQLLSLLLQPHPALRCAPDRIAGNRLSQNDLWRMGISGDLPILLLTLDDPSDTQLLGNLVGAHRLWSRRSISVDLVVLYTAPSGYTDPVADELHRRLEQLGALGILRRHAGVHLLRADQLRAEDTQLLAAAARAVLAGNRTLDEQLGDVHRQPEHLPVLAPAEPAAPLPASADLERSKNLAFDNGTGGFSADGKAYVIHLVPGAATPAPWCNVLANREFGTLVSETGGGYTWSLNASERRLTPWRNDPVSDPPAEALYLRDEETAEVWMPAAASTDTAVEVRHEAGQTTWRRRAHGLEQTVEVLVAADDPVKLVRLRLHDTMGRPRRITATYYVEWVLGTNRETCSALLVPEYDTAAGALLARNPWSPPFAERVAFLVSDRDPHGFTTDRCEFVGREGDVRRPMALSRWGLSGTARPGPDPCAALQIHLELAAGGHVEAHFALGEGRDRDHALQLVERWRNPAAVESATTAVRERWDDLLGALTVHTPDGALDLMINRWLLYQAVSSRVFGRTGYYQSSGAFGFRDQLQDVMALVLAAPMTARERILDCSRRQFVEGDVLHWWHPPDGRGVRTRCSDDLLWLPFVTAFYVEATGDASVLDERVPYLTAAPLAAGEEDRYGLFEHGAEEGTVFEHCERALARGMTRGAHGLPLIGTGDWNDGMNRVGNHGRGESVWLAWFAIATARAFARLCGPRGAEDLAVGWNRRADELSAAVESAGWDGEWYRRAYDDDDRPWGSAACEECRIDSIAQSWAVLSSAADKDRARRALASAEHELVREADGVACLLWPPFDKTPRDPGYIKAYPPGVRENGGQYTHAAAWLAWAFAAIGDGERATRVLGIINPIEHARTADAVTHYRVEPYVVAADIASARPYTGRGGWTWYTGSAAWTYRAAVEGVLGLRLSHGRLRIEPCLPPSWPGYRAVIRTSGGTLEVEVDNAHGVGRGVAAMCIDGHPFDGETIELPSGGVQRHVRVRLGRESDARRAVRSGAGARE